MGLEVRLEGEGPSVGPSQRQIKASWPRRVMVQGDRAKRKKTELCCGLGGPLAARTIVHLCGMISLHPWATHAWKKFECVGGAVSYNRNVCLCRISNLHTRATARMRSRMHTSCVHAGSLACAGEACGQGEWEPKKDSSHLSFSTCVSYAALQEDFYTNLKFKRG